MISAKFDRIHAFSTMASVHSRSYVQSERSSAFYSGAVMIVAVNAFLKPVPV